MGRRGGGGRRSSGGGLFGRAPSRRASTSTKSNSKQTKSSSASRAPAPARTTPRSSAPAMQQPSSGGMMGGLGSMIMQGMAFGGGSAIAHRAVDAVAGPRQIETVHRDESNSVQQPSANASSSFVKSQPQEEVCRNEMQQFAQCLQQNNSNISSCSFFYQQLGQCQQESM